MFRIRITFFLSDYNGGGARDEAKEDTVAGRAKEQGGSKGEGVCGGGTYGRSREQN